MSRRTILLIILLVLVAAGSLFLYYTQTVAPALLSQIVKQYSLNAGEPKWTWGGKEITKGDNPQELNSSKKVEYRLWADGLGPEVYISLFLPASKNTNGTEKAETCFVNLETGACRRPGKNYSMRRFSTEVSFTPQGQTIIAVTKTVKPQNPSDSANIQYCFYNAFSDQLKPFPKTIPDSVLIECLGWIPGTDLLVVQEINPITLTKCQAAIHQIDSNGNVLSTLSLNEKAQFSSAGLWSTKWNSFDSLGTAVVSHTAVSLYPFDGKPKVEADAPEGQMLAGWSPDLRHILLTQARKDLLYPLKPNITYQLYHVHSWLKCDREETNGVIGTGSVGVSLGPLKYEAEVHPTQPKIPPITKEQLAAASNAPISFELWDRQADRKTPFFQLPAVPYGPRSGPYFGGYADCGFFFTNEGIIAQIRNWLDQPPAFRYYSFKTGQWKDLLPEKWKADSFDCVFDPEGKRVCISVQKPQEANVTGGDRVPMKTSASKEADVAREPPDISYEYRNVLVDLESGAITLIPFSIWRNSAMIMKNGSVVGIDKDDLIIFNPQTGEKRVVVKDIYATWKSLAPKE